MQSRILATNQNFVGFSTTGDGSVNNPAPAKINDGGAPTCNLHVSIVGGTSASVSIFGRAGGPGHPFTQIGAAITATGLSSIALFPEMYAQVTANVGGAVVNAAINYPISGA